MIKLDTKLQNTSVAIAPASLPDASTPHGTGPKTHQHLIVLIPNIESDYTAIMPRVWELAYALKCHVLFLGLCSDASEEPGLRRTLVTLSALIQDSWVSAEVKTEIGSDWLKLVKSNWQAGDLIVCFAEQRTGLLRRPLSRTLESNLKIPVYLLSGLYAQRPKSDWLTQVFGWLGSIGIITGFSILQVNILQVPEGWFQNVLLVLSIIPEFWLIWVWNNLFS